MAENENGQEKTEEPSLKRLQDAREKGNVPRSRELATVAVFGAGVASLLAMGGSVTVQAKDWMRGALSPDIALLESPQDMFGYTGDLLLGFLWILAPLMLATLLVLTTLLLRRAPAGSSPVPGREFSVLSIVFILHNHRSNASFAAARRRRRASPPARREACASRLRKGGRRLPPLGANAMLARAGYIRPTNERAQLLARWAPVSIRLEHRIE